MSKRLTRRRLFGLAGTAAAGSAGLLLDGCQTGAGLRNRTHVVTTAGNAGKTAFVTRPDFHVPPVTVRQYGPVSTSRYIFLDVPYSAPGHGGAVIIDSRGDVVWFGPNTATEHKMNVNAQVLGGRPVLTWWQGVVVDGHGEGEAVIADSSYRVTHVIRAHNAVHADLHEFVITPQGTALISAYRTHSGVDLSALGGPASGHILSGVMQEIDIATGDLLFEWDSYDPVDPPVPHTESKRPVQDEGTPDLPWDYFHINSIDQDAEGNFLVSGRATWTIYNVSKTDGSIIWRMNSADPAHSDFTLGPGASFAWQHHVRTHGHGKLTIFDNGAAGTYSAIEKRSRALILDFDESTKQVTLVRAFAHPGEPVLATALGSAQILPGGQMFVNWGTERRFSQFSAAGELLLDGTMVLGADSYRAFSKPWTGHPLELPRAAARHRAGGGATVYASWNGATEVASWTVFAGTSTASLTSIGTVRRSGFETAIAARSRGPYFAVQANDAAGRALSKSRPVRIA